MDRAGPARAMRTSRVLPVIGWMLCLVLVGFIGLVVVLAIITPPSDHDRGRSIAGGATDADDRNESDAAAASDDPHATEQQTADGEPPAASGDNERNAVAPASKPPKQSPPATTDAIPEPKPIDPATLEPWDRPGPAPQSGALVLFEELGKKIAAPRDTDLRQWFTTVKDQQSNITQRDVWGVQDG